MNVIQYRSGQRTGSVTPTYQLTPIREHYTAATGLKRLASDLTGVVIAMVLPMLVLFF